MKVPPRIEYWPTSTMYVDPELEIAPIDPEKENDVYESIVKFGFLDYLPILAWQRNDGVFILKGRTQFAAAKRAGKNEVPIIRLDFRNYAEARLMLESINGGRRQFSHAVILHNLVHIRFHGWGGDRRSKNFKLSSDDLKPAMEIEETTIERAAKKLHVSASTVMRVWNRYYKPLSEEQRQLVRQGELSPYKLVQQLDASEESQKKIDAESFPQKEGEKPTRSKSRRSDEILLQKCGFIDEEIPILCRIAKRKGLSVKDYITSLGRAKIARERSEVNRLDQSNDDDNQSSSSPKDDLQTALKPGKEREFSMKSAHNQTNNETSETKVRPSLKTNFASIVNKEKSPEQQFAENSGNEEDAYTDRKGLESTSRIAKGRPETKENHFWKDCQIRLLWVIYLETPKSARSTVAAKYHEFELKLLGPKHARIHTLKAVTCKLEKMIESPPEPVQFLIRITSENELIEAKTEAISKISQLPNE